MGLVYLLKILYLREESKERFVATSYSLIATVLQVAQRIQTAKLEVNKVACNILKTAQVGQKDLDSNTCRCKPTRMALT